MQSHVMLVTCDVDTTLATSQFYQCFIIGDLKMFRTCIDYIVFEIHWLKLSSLAESHHLSRFFGLSIFCV